MTSGLVRAAGALTVATALAGCGAGTAANSTSVAASSPPRLQPQLVMAGPDSGLLVWRSGSVSVLLTTTDGFRTVTNATPPAVPTDGGLLLARSGSHVLVGVLPTGALSVSPVLLGDGTPTGWSGGQLPGGLADRPEAVAFQGTALWALVGSGSSTELVTATAAEGPWQVAASASSLDPSQRLRLTGVRWTDATHGWLSGSAPAGRTVLFRQAVGGWRPVPLAAPQGTAAALQEAASTPCGTGSDLVDLVTTRPSSGGPGTAVVERTADGGTSWRPGAPVALPAGDPAWACSAGRVWLAVPDGSAARLLASTDGGQAWQDEGTAPGPVTDLAITGADTGYAVTGEGTAARLWSVSASGQSFAPVALPGWVAQLGVGGES